jgi:hypothetical protein
MLMKMFLFFSGFPIKTDIPLFWGIYAEVQFENFEWKNGSGLALK